MRHALALLILLLALLSRGPSAAHAVSPEDPPWVKPFEAWLAAIEAHTPGLVDDAVKKAGGWTPSELELMAPYLDGLLALLPPPANATRPMPMPKLKGDDVDRLLVYASQTPAKRGRNYLLKRGALLHANVMMFRLAAWRQVATAEAARRMAGPTGNIVAYGLDGQAKGFGVAPPHWGVARRLIDRVDGDTPSVRLWYRATTAFLLLNNHWGEADQHLRHAAWLGEDAGTLFDQGCLFEAYTLDRLRGVMDAATDERVSWRVPSLNESYRRAEASFRRAAELAPDLIEARVRLAHVLSGRGAHKEAARELRPIQTASPASIVGYYAALFLGDAEQALGRRDAAADAYRRAAQLYPRAQTPHLALSLLWIDGGDRKQAEFALKHVLDLPGDEASRVDPWWNYHSGTGRIAEPFVAALWRSFIKDPPQ